MLGAKKKEEKKVIQKKARGNQVANKNLSWVECLSSCYDTDISSGINFQFLETAFQKQKCYMKYPWH